MLALVSQGSWLANTCLPRNEGATKSEGLKLSKPIHAKEEKNGLPTTDQGLFTANTAAATSMSPLRRPHPFPPIPPFLLQSTHRPRNLFHLCNCVTSSNLSNELNAVNFQALYLQVRNLNRDDTYTVCWEICLL